MGEYYIKPASVYCAKAFVASKKPTPTTAVKVEGIGVCMRYRCERDSSAEISKEISPKVCQNDGGAHMDLGDKIEGEIIDVWVKGIKPQDLKKLGGYSARHKSQGFQTWDATYAALVQPFVHIENAVRNRAGA